MSTQKAKPPKYYMFYQSIEHHNPMLSSNFKSLPLEIKIKFLTKLPNSATDDASCCPNQSRRGMRMDADAFVDLCVCIQPPSPPSASCTRKLLLKLGKLQSGPAMRQSLGRPLFNPTATCMHQPALPRSLPKLSYSQFTCLRPHQCFETIKIAATTAITAPMRFVDVPRALDAEGSADNGICPFVDFTLHTSTEQ